MSHGHGGHGGQEDGRRVAPFWQGEETHSSMSASQRPAPTRCAALPTTLHCAVYVGATAALVPSRRASLSSSADIHLNVLNDSYDRMYI